MINFLHIWLSPCIFALVLLLGIIQVQTYAIKYRPMPMEIFVFYVMFYSCAALYFLLRIILGYQNG